MLPSDMTNNKRKAEDDDNERDGLFYYYKRILMADLDTERDPTNNDFWPKWFLCRTCRRWSNSKRGLSIHYWQMHGQNVSLSNIEEFSDNEHFVKQPVKRFVKKSVKQSVKQLIGSCVGDVRPAVWAQKEEVFNCDVCSEVCTSALKLLVHKRLHIGRARIYCDICEMTFEKRVHLLKHVRMRHSDRVPSFTRRSAPLTPTATVSNVTVPTATISTATFPRYTLPTVSFSTAIAPFATVLVTTIPIAIFPIPTVSTHIVSTPIVSIPIVSIPIATIPIATVQDSFTSNTTSPTVPSPNVCITAINIYCSDQKNRTTPTAWAVAIIHIQPTARTSPNFAVDTTAEAGDGSR